MPGRYRALTLGGTVAVYGPVLASLEACAAGNRNDAPGTVLACAGATIDTILGD